MIRISDHAYKKAKERLSWNKNATKRMAEKAYNNGTEVSSDNNKRVVFLNDIVYIFKENCLATLYKSGRNLKDNLL